MNSINDRGLVRTDAQEAAHQRRLKARRLRRKHWYINVAGQLHSDEACTYEEAHELKDWYSVHRPGCPVILETRCC